MDDENTRQEPGRGRRRWLRMIAGGLVLGLAGVAAGNLLFPDRTPPTLRDLSLRDPARDAKLTARLRARFPTGTPETVVARALLAEGFKIRYGTSTSGASWEGGDGMFCMRVAQITWDTVYGRVTAWGGVPAISGRLGPICP